MLLVALICTEYDFRQNSPRLSRSITNFYTVFGDDVFFLVVFQSKSEDASLVSEFFSHLPDCQHEIFLVSYLSVSRARNDALDFAKNNSFSRIIFHDSSLIYTKSFLKWANSKSHDSLISGRFVFSEEVQSEEEGNESVICLDVFRNSFVCAYFLSLKFKFPKFDERFGPGENTVYSSGEDFLFLKKFFELNPVIRKITKYEGVGILHPPRPADFSKHLLYAEGQGKIHQIFLKEEKSLYAVWRCVLFFGNAIFRVLLFKKKSFKILLLRIKGFFDFRVKI